MTIIRQMLNDKNMSQSQLSYASKIPQSSLNMIINLKLYPCPAWRRRIAEVLEVPESILFPADVITGSTSTEKNYQGSR